MFSRSQPDLDHSMNPSLLQVQNWKRNQIIFSLSWVFTANPNAHYIIVKIPFYNKHFLYLVPNTWNSCK